MIASDAGIRHSLGALLDLFKKPGITEICVNEPKIVLYKVGNEWIEEKHDFMTFENAISLGVAIASYSEQEWSAENPIMYATLPDGERITMVMPPTVPEKTVSITIRVPSYGSMNMHQYKSSGMFDTVALQKKELSKEDIELKQLRDEGDFQKFFEKAVEYRKNIAIVGDTGSGKTTFMKAICQLIDPTDRIVTIEDVRELFLPKHINKVHLTYSTQGKAQINPADLVKATMRMYPTRVLPAELRGAEAFDFIDLLTTGHNGSITSFHSESCAVAPERFALMCKKHPHANTYTHAELMRLIYMTLDVIAHVHNVNGKRSFSEVYFDPDKKLGISRG